MGRVAELCASPAVKCCVATAKNVVYWFTHAHVRKTWQGQLCWPLERERERGGEGYSHGRWGFCPSDWTTMKWRVFSVATFTT